MGFTFDDVAAAKGEAESLAAMRALIARAPRNAERIFPHIGGEEVNSDPCHVFHRYVIDFVDFPLKREPQSKTWVAMTDREHQDALREGFVLIEYPDAVAEDWPDLLEIIAQRVKRGRSAQNREAHARRWWKFGDRQPSLCKAIAEFDSVLAINFGALTQRALAKMHSINIFAHTLCIFAFSSPTHFVVLQSNVHECWARFFSSTTGDGLRYTPSDSFRNFPFPANFETDPALEAAGEASHAFRAKLMIARNEGLTKTYNRFHARFAVAQDIATLRTLHAQMAAAVLTAYGCSNSKWPMRR